MQTNAVQLRHLSIIFRTRLGHFQRLRRYSKTCPKATQTHSVATSSQIWLESARLCMYILRLRTITHIIFTGIHTSRGKTSNFSYRHMSVSLYTPSSSPFFRAIHLHETRVSHSFSLKRETLSLGCFCSMSSMKVRAHAYMRVYVLYAFALIASVVMCVSHAFRYTRERVCNVCEEVARGCLVWLRVYWLNLRLAVVRRYCNVQCNERLGATVVERWVKRSCQRRNWMQKC